MRFKDILNESELTIYDKTAIEKLIKKLSPKTKIKFSKTGRRIFLEGPDDTGEIYIGVSTGKIFVKTSYDSSGEEEHNISYAIESILKQIDLAFNKKEFNRLVKIAKEGDSDEI